MTHKTKVWMMPSEIALIDSYITDTDIYLEWGSGGSTEKLGTKAKRAFSIEHDLTWYAEMLPKLESAAITYIGCRF